MITSREKQLTDNLTRLQVARDILNGVEWSSEDTEAFNTWVKVKALIGEQINGIWGRLEIDETGRKRLSPDSMVQLGLITPEQEEAIDRAENDPKTWEVDAADGKEFEGKIPFTQERMDS